MSDYLRIIPTATAAVCSGTRVLVVGSPEPSIDELLNETRIIMPEMPRILHVVTNYPREAAETEAIEIQEHCAPCGQPVKKRGQICQRCQKARNRRRL